MFRYKVFQQGLTPREDKSEEVGLNYGGNGSVAGTVYDPEGGTLEQVLGIWETKLKVR